MIAVWKALLASSQRRAMLVTLGICVALLLAGVIALQLVKAGRTRAQTDLAQARDLTAQASDTAQKLAPLVRDPDALVALHRRLQSRGLIGEPDRSRWLSALQQTLEGGRWLDSRYLLASGEDVPMPAQTQEWLDILGETAPRLSGQPLTLTLEGTHEPEVLSVLGRLMASRAGNLEVLSCDLRRRDDVLGLDATCQLRWLSLYEPPAELPEEAPEDAS